MRRSRMAMGCSRRPRDRGTSGCWRVAVAVALVVGFLLPGVAPRPLAAGEPGDRRAGSRQGQEAGSQEGEEAGSRQGQAAEPTAIRGAWRPVSYVLDSGAAHSVDGLIQFGEEDWSVVFFVLDDDGQPGRASAEGGTYTLEGDRVVFTHRFHFSVGEEMEGLAAQPLRMSIAGEGEGTTEPTRWDVEDELLVLSFPSGNRMIFKRSPPEPSRPPRRDGPGSGSRPGGGGP